ncbi:unnamed protein product [Bursaphelenchus okinawaensis]|uniref:Uncharacterized protein n=1 Tax=Bursaphelenchus okinawaensis TaxID=465554 RepID=A0A811K312_9BILA|nr:unnamed protein product [Bursaphelenchus okinawaensis]CAG9090248.1 unnamed protein product [Bursaphelenchus okinawaensis]
MINYNGLRTDYVRYYNADYLKKLKKPKARLRCKLRTRLFDRYFGGSEVHGLLLAFSKEITRPYQVVWIIFLLVTTIISAITTRTTIHEFYEHQTATSFTIKQVLALDYPSLIVCPKNPDALRVDDAVAELRQVFPKLSKESAELIIAYAIADAGFANMDKKLGHLTDEHHKKLGYYLKQFKEKTKVNDVHVYIFKKYGYKCEDLFTYCRVAKTEIPCCDVFEEHYLMLRGRCFRLKKWNMTQVDPDDRGSFHVRMKQLDAPLTASNRKQPQVIAYLTQPGREISTYPRFYINYRSYNVIKCKMRRIKMLDSNKYCIADADYGGRDDCYIRKWLYHRLIVPLNCTVFYMKDKNDQHQLCPVGLVASNYENIQNLTIDDSDCLPACARNDITCSHSFDEDTPTRQYIFSKSFPDFQIEFGFSDLEVMLCSV